MSAGSISLVKGLYRHYKGSYYKVIDVATHSETEEKVVVYQALYGEKGTWVRPASMFDETVIVNGETVQRFAFVDPQTEVVEVAVLDVKQGEESAFEVAFKQAASIIVSVSGYISHSLSRCVEVESRYLLLVSWQTIESHEIVFRQSEHYQQWKALLNHFYDRLPAVEHYRHLNVDHVECL